MGQCPSASCLPVSAAGRGNFTDGDDPPRRVMGCLPAPGGCLLPFGFGLGGESRRAAAFVELGEGSEMAMIGVATAIDDDETPPDELVLTDVEDEEDECDDRHVTGEERLQQEGVGEAAIPALSAEEESQQMKDAGIFPPPIPDDALARIVAVDCGMVQVKVGTGGKPSRRRAGRGKKGGRRPSMQVVQALRRVSVVDGRGRTLLSALVRVEDSEERSRREAADADKGGYLSLLGLLPLRRPQPRPRPRITRTGDNLDIGVPAEEIREEARRLLRGKIVVGHSVEGDLSVLGLGKNGVRLRDFEARDTASYIPFLKRKNIPGGPGQSAHKLRDLVKERLYREIQCESFHCCEEDAIAALDLYKSVYHEWEGQLKATGEIEKQLAPMEQRRKRLMNKREPRRRPQAGRTSIRRGQIPPSPRFFGLFSSLLLLFHDFANPMTEVRRLATHISEQLLGTKTVTLKLSARQRKATKKAAKRSRRKSRMHGLMRRFRKNSVDNLFLLVHCLLEAYIIVSLVLFHGSPQWWDIVSVQRANGALTVGLVGASLFRMKSGNHLCRALYGILAQYHIVSWWARMAGGDPEAVVLTSHETPNHAIASLKKMFLRDYVQPSSLIAKHSVWALVRQMIWAKNRVAQTDEHDADMFLGCILSKKFEPVGWIVAAATPYIDEASLLRAFDIASFCWFTLQSLNKL